MTRHVKYVTAWEVLILLPMRWDEWGPLTERYRAWRQSRRAGEWRTNSDVRRCLEFAEWSRVAPSAVTHEQLMAYMVRPRRFSTSEASACAEVNAVVRVLDFGRGIEDMGRPAYVRPSSSRARARDTPARLGEPVPSVAELERMLVAAAPEPDMPVVRPGRVQDPLQAPAPAELATWPGLLEAYTVDALARGLSASTVASYAKKTRTFAGACGVRPSHVNAGHVAAFLSRPGVRLATVKTDRGALRSVLAYATERGLLCANPADGVLLAEECAPVDAVRVASAAPGAGARIDVGMLTAHPVRAWAASQGHHVAATGALAPDLLAAWRQAGFPG